MDGQDTKFRSRRPHLRHFIIGELSATQMTGIYIRRSGYQPPIAQAFTLHFETVHRHMMSCGGGGTCQMQGKGRLAHGRTGGNDIQVAPLPARSQAVQVGKTGGDARNPVRAGCPTRIHLLQRIIHQGIHITQVLDGAAFSLQAVQQIMGIHQRVADVRRFIGCKRQEFMESEYHLPPQVLLAQNQHMIFQVHRRRHPAADTGQLIRPSCRIQLAACHKLILHRDNIYLPPFPVHHLHGGINQSVLIKIEHLRTQAVCHHRHRFAPYEAGSKYNFFKFRILRIQYFSHYIICVLW